MPFLPTSKGLIIRHGAYTIVADELTSSTLGGLIDEQMQDVEANYPYLIPMIESDLVLLNQLDDLLTTEGGSTDAALVRADVLEWVPGMKTSGISNRYNEIRLRVARMLTNSIRASNGGGGGQGALLRG